MSNSIATQRSASVQNYAANEVGRKEDWEDDLPDTFCVRFRSLLNLRIPWRLKNHIGVEGLFYLRCMQNLSILFMLLSPFPLIIAALYYFNDAFDARDSRCGNSFIAVAFSLSNESSTRHAYYTVSVAFVISSIISIRAVHQHLRLDEAKHMPSQRSDNADSNGACLLPIDFCVVVRPVPKSLDDPKQLQKYMSFYGEVTFCDLIPDQAKLMKKVVRLKALESLLAKAESAKWELEHNTLLEHFHGQKNAFANLEGYVERKLTDMEHMLEDSLHVKIDKLSHEIMDLMDRADGTSSSCGLVTFSWLSGALHALRAHISPFGLHCHRSCAQARDGLGGKRVHVYHASSDPIWQNHVGLGPGTRFLGYTLCLLGASCCVALNCAVLVIMKKKIETGSDGSGVIVVQILAGIVMMVSNFGCKTFIQKLAHVTFEHSCQDERRSQMILIGLAKSLNCTVVVLICYPKLFEPGCYDDVTGVLMFYFLGVAWPALAKPTAIFFLGQRIPIPFDYCESFYNIMPIASFGLCFLFPFPCAFPFVSIVITVHTALNKSNLIYLFPPTESTGFTLPAIFLLMIGITQIPWMFVGAWFAKSQGYKEVCQTLMSIIFPCLLITLSVMYLVHKSRVAREPATEHEYKITYVDIAGQDDRSGSAKRYNFNDPPLIISPKMPGRIVVSHWFAGNGSPANDSPANDSPANDSLETLSELNERTLLQHVVAEAIAAQRPTTTNPSPAYPNPTCSISISKKNAPEAQRHDGSTRRNHLRSSLPDADSAKADVKATYVASDVVATSKEPTLFPSVVTDASVAGGLVTSDPTCNINIARKPAPEAQRHDGSTRRNHLRSSLPDADDAKADMEATYVASEVVATSKEPTLFPSVVNDDSVAGGLVTSDTTSSIIITRKTAPAGRRHDGSTKRNHLRSLLPDASNAKTDIEATVVASEAVSSLGEAAPFQFVVTDASATGGPATSDNMSSMPSTRKPVPAARRRDGSIKRIQLKDTE